MEKIKPKRLTPEQAAAKAELTGLFQCFPVNGTDRERAAKFEAYWSLLEELPPKTVIEACRQACRGELSSIEFLPSVAQLYDAAKKLCPKYDAPKIALPPPPREMPTASKAIIGRGMAALAEWLKTNSPEALDRVTAADRELRQQEAGSASSSAGR